MGLKRAKYDKNRDFDGMLSSFIKNEVIPACTDKDDDVLVLCSGKTGSGKSMLMLHAYEDYAGDTASIDYVSFNRSNLADNLDKIKNVPKGIRFNGYDEANVSKRDALTQFNKALLDVYYTIRGLNIFHWWNNPSVDIIDKPFIKDRVTGLFLITTHTVDKPRIYYYFDKKALLQVLHKYKNLDYETLSKVKKKYAMYKGWFRDYNGFLKKDYLAKKNPRMEEKVREFKAMFGTKTSDTGEKLYTINDVANLSGYSKSYIGDLRKKGFFDKDDYVVENVTNIFYKLSALKKLYNRKKSFHSSTLVNLNPEFKLLMEGEA